MEMLSVYLLFAVGIVLIVKCGDWFVDGAVWIAEVTGIPKFIIGATIISVATTLPEIIVSSIAAMEGHEILVAGVGNYLAESQGKVGMAIGNGIGSVICNTALIMAISMIFMPVGIERKSFAPKAGLLLAAVLSLFGMSMGGSLGLPGAFVLLAIFVLYILENLRSAGREKSSGEESRPEYNRRALARNLFLIIGGAVGIVIGSQLLVDNGCLIAASWGVSEAIIGVTMVAVGTSLPELVTAITAVVKKQASMSVGNVIGANVIDTTLILASCSFIYGGSLPVSAQNLYLDFPMAILVTLVAVIPTLINKKFVRWQGVGLVVLYLVYLFVVSTKLTWYLSLFGIYSL